MKKPNCSFWLIAVFFVICTVGCGSSLNEKEKKIVGNWHYTVSEDEEEFKELYGNDSFIVGLTISGESEDEYMSDNTEKEQGSIVFSFHVQDEDYEEWIDLAYDCSYEGTWNAKGNKLITKGKKFEVEFSHFKTLQKYDAEVDGYYINVLKSFVEKLIPEWRHDVLAKRTQEIVNLSDDEMTLKDEGEETTYIRIE